MRRPEICALTPEDIDGDVVTINKALVQSGNGEWVVKQPLHKLRHYFASQMSALGVPEADIMRMGGWGTDHVMKSVYRHSMMDRDEAAKRDAAEKLRNALFS